MKMFSMKILINFPLHIHLYIIVLYLRLIKILHIFFSIYLFFKNLFKKICFNKFLNIIVNSNRNYDISVFNLNIGKKIYFQVIINNH